MDQLAGEGLRPAEIALKKHALPPLPYALDALKQCIDERTMTLHHDMHHAGYVEKLNAALKPHPDLRGASALWLLRNLEKVPEDIRTAVHHNAGGHVNHSMFWRAMKPDAGVGPKAGAASAGPKGPLLEAINRDFGSFTAFKTLFEKQGAGLFGSGWVWLARTRQDSGKLVVMTTPGHDNPMMQDQFPLLLNDVWEHAYYLKYENRRAEYLKAWWAVTDWDEAAGRFESSDNPSDLWEGEGGSLLPTADTPETPGTP